MATTSAEILDLGADAVVEIAWGPNRTVRGNAMRVIPDEDLTTHTFTNPRPLRADAGPNHAQFYRNERLEDATYNVTPLKTDETYKSYRRLRNGTPVCIWISPQGLGTGERFITFEGVSTCSETVDAGLKRLNLTVVLNAMTTTGTN